MALPRTLLPPDDRASQAVRRLRPSGWVIVQAIPSQNCMTMARTCSRSPARDGSDTRQFFG